MDDVHVDIRAMVEGDRSMVFALAEEVLRPLAQSAGHPELFHEDEFLALMARAEVWVADSPRPLSEMAGYVVTEVEGDADCLTVRCLCVSPAFEGRHVGHRLLDWAEGLAYDRRLGRLAAPLPETDSHALGLYRAHSFVARREEERPQMIIMEKRLR